jgi:hypothetical protein
MLVDTTLPTLLYVISRDLAFPRLSEIEVNRRTNTVSYADDWLPKSLRILLGPQ